MNRNEYLGNADVADFIEWARHLVRGDWWLKHAWKAKRGPSFQCGTLFGAFKSYEWNGERFDDTMSKFAEFRKKFDTIGKIVDEDSRDSFVANVRNIVKWGRIGRLPRLEKEWAQMEPARLQEHIEEVKRKLNPASGDTSDLRGFRYMGSAFNKIYSALVPGLPIYDSRVACALACLVRLYYKDNRSTSVPSLLNLGIPRGRVFSRCKSPKIYSDSKYAAYTLKAAWLLHGMVQYSAGAFDEVPKQQRIHALQSAMFMLGYKRLNDDAVTPLKAEDTNPPDEAKSPFTGEFSKEMEVVERPNRPFREERLWFERETLT